MSQEVHIRSNVDFCLFFVVFVLASGFCFSSLLLSDCRTIIINFYGAPEGVLCIIPDGGDGVHCALCLSADFCRQCFFFFFFRELLVMLMLAFDRWKFLLLCFFCTLG